MAYLTAHNDYPDDGYISITALRVIGCEVFEPNLNLQFRQRKLAKYLILKMLNKTVQNNGGLQFVKIKKKKKKEQMRLFRLPLYINLSVSEEDSCLVLLSC